jgi:hypothetical protein
MLYQSKYAQVNCHMLNSSTSSTSSVNDKGSQLTLLRIVMLILGVDPSELRFMNMKSNIENSVDPHLWISSNVPRRKVSCQAKVQSSTFNLQNIDTSVKPASVFGKMSIAFHWSQVTLSRLQRKFSPSLFKNAEARNVCKPCHWIL